MQLQIIIAMIVLAIVIVFIVLKLSKIPHEATKPPKEEQKQQVKEVKQKEYLDEEAKKELKPTEIKQIKICRKKREVPHHKKIIKDDFIKFKGMKILIAEDNVINQKVILGLLSDSGINITIANNGKEVLDILKNNKDFELILMDAHMPIMDGFEATRIIRKDSSLEHIAVVALSGDTASDEIKNMLNVGMESHVEKPLKMDALYNVFYVYANKINNNKAVFTEDEYIEFDVAKGLEICGGDKEFYNEILDDFISKYANSAEIIHEYINNSDSINANKILLDIIGVAANIGAKDLHDVALELKHSMQNSDDMEYITNLKRYERSLKRVCDAIFKYQKN